MSQFIIQYTLVILTIILIPVLLRIGKDRDIARLTYSVFIVLVVSDICAYFFMSQQPSFVYIAVMTVLAAFFVNRKKKD